MKILRCQFNSYEYINIQPDSRIKTITDYLHLSSESTYLTKLH